jgi:hypothetical protein
MKKLLLLSVLFVTLGIPAVTAKDPSAQRGLRRTLLYSAVFYVFYWLSLLFVVPRLD